MHKASSRIIRMVLILTILGLVTALLIGRMIKRSPSPELLNEFEDFSAQLKIADDFVLRNQDDLLKTSKTIPQEIVSGLHTFFSDENARRLFVTHCKNHFIALPVWNRMKTDGGIRKQLLKQNDADYMKKYGKIKIKAAERDALFFKLNKKFGLINLNEKGETYVLTSPLWKGYVVKIAQYRWIDNDAMRAFPYQLISRIFYNKEINAYIKNNNLENSVYHLEKALYHIPNTPTDINDDNYIIVEPLLPLPSESENKRRLSKILVDEKESDALENLKNIIRHNGLWTISTRTVYILDDGKIAFVETERPGLGGSEWRYFFHQGQGAAAEIMRNAQGGLDSLKNIGSK